MNGMNRRRPGSSAFHGAGAEPDSARRLHRSQLPASPVGVCAALPPPSGLRQNCMELNKVISFYLKKEKMSIRPLFIDLQHYLVKPAGRRLLREVQGVGRPRRRSREGSRTARETRSPAGFTYRLFFKSERLCLHTEAAATYSGCFFWIPILYMRKTGFNPALFVLKENNKVL